MSFCNIYVKRLLRLYFPIGIMVLKFGNTGWRKSNLSRGEDFVF
jgi:hypothetical protein